MFILLIGSDARGNSYSVGLADSIRIVRVDFVEPGIQVLAFQRDMYVEIPGLEANNITHGKLNQAYLYGNPGYAFYDGEGQGPGLMALTLEHNFGTQVDRYIALNLTTFVKIVDELGGIDINLPYTIDGRVKRSRDPNRYFAAGKQHLNGYRTMLLARLRPQGDFQRMEVQNLILQAFAEKLLDPEAILKWPQLIRKFSSAVQMDLSPAEITQLLCLRARLGKQAVDYRSFPETLFKSDRVRDPVLGNTSIQVADFEVLRIYGRAFNEGRWLLPPEHRRDEVNP
jgi:LCP family protein required for cell wall assembly